MSTGVDISKEPIIINEYKAKEESLVTKHDGPKANVAIYTRVSTTMQVEKGHSLDTQERLCREYCDRQWGTRQL